MADKQIKLGVVLMNLGGPTTAEAVRPFLYNLFSDTDIIKLGGGAVQNSLARTISKFRSPKVADKYRMISGCTNGCEGNHLCPNRKEGKISDCCSPINHLTEAQRQALELALKEALPGTFVKVYTAMRYWVPFAGPTMDEMTADGITHTVLLPLYPHFSWTTSGSSYRDWENVKKEKKIEDKSGWEEYIIKNYHLNDHYLRAMNARIDETLADFDDVVRPKTHFLFSAHGTPVSEVASGDVYTKHIEETVEAIMKLRNRHEPYWLGYQSRVGPSKWTQPNTVDLIKRLLDYGIRNLLVIPVAFVTDHIETLHELNVELREELREEGYIVENLKVIKGLNDHPLFISALLDEVMKRVRHLFKNVNTKSPANETRSRVSP